MRPIAGTFLLYLLLVYVGLMGILTAYAHVFRPVQTSASIGWSTSPYEYEVGIWPIWTVGVLGILCLWLRGNFWLANGHCQRRLATGRLCRSCSADSANQQSCS